MKKNRVLLIAVILILSTQIFAQGYYAVLPVRALGIDDGTTQTVNMLLRQEITSETGKELVSQSLTEQTVEDANCMDLECAVDIGTKLGAKKVVSASLSKLGHKVIVQFMLFDIEENRTILADNVVSNSVEDLEMVVKRIAASISQEEPIEDTAEIGYLVQNENKSINRRRRARRYTGLSFGYLFPIEGYSYDGDEELTADFRAGYEMTNTAVGALFAIRHGFATNIYVHYLMTTTDVCPYIGGALGFHWISHFDGYYDDKRSDGLELTGSAGLRLFRTYNFQVVINFDYTYTFNDYDEQALVFTLGLLK